MSERNERADKRTIGFHDRYENDSEFKRQVDEGRARSKETRGQQELKSALSMFREKRKLY